MSPALFLVLIWSTGRTLEILRVAIQPKTLPTALAQRQSCCHPFLSTMSSTPSLVFSLDQHLNCSWISISSCGKGSGFINSFSSLNTLIYNKVCAGEPRARSINRKKWGRGTKVVTQFSLFPLFIHDHLFLSLLSPSLFFSIVWFSFYSDPK